MVKGDHHIDYDQIVPELQADATINIAPVSGVKNLILDTSELIRLMTMAIQVTWTVQPTPLEIHATIDGQSFIFTVANPVSATWYYAHLNAANSITTQPLDASTFSYNRAFLLDARSVKIEGEITGGTVSNMLARVRYAHW